MAPQLPRHHIQSAQRDLGRHPVPEKSLDDLDPPHGIRQYVDAFLLRQAREAARDRILAFKIPAEFMQEGLQAGYADAANAVECARADDGKIGEGGVWVEVDLVGLGRPGGVGYVLGV